MIKLKNKLKFMSIVLMLSISTNSIAAVGANDGSAFITKAEFDALVNTFNEQLDMMVKSLPSKIDGAIANYLAGLDNIQTISLENYVSTAYNQSPKYVQFMLFSTPKETIDVEDVIGGVGIYISAGIQANNQAQSGYYGYFGTNNVIAWAGNYQEVDYTNYTGNKDNYTSAYYFANFPFTDSQGNKLYTDWTLESLERERVQYKLYCSYISFQSAQLPSISRTSTTAYNIDYTSLTQPGSTNKSIGTIYGNDIQPYLAQTHEWTRYAEENVDKEANAFLDYNLSGTVEGDDYCVDYEYRDYYDEDVTKSVEIQSNKPGNQKQGSRQGNDFSMLRQGTRYYDQTTNNEFNNNVTYTFKYHTPEFRKLKWENLTSDYWNEVLGEPHYKYQGIPVTKVNTVGKVTIQMILNNAKAGSYVYALSDTKFPNGDIPESIKINNVERIITRGTVSRSGDEVIKVEWDKKNIYDASNGDYIYLKVQPANAEHVVTARVESVTERIGE